ncbi:unnamed protein product [Soboliphyme baturini]|uniref:Myosin motor domain-containing protein n=1 Tax=Soboliphyme baturini TaxID=241478 RepID=A0A183I9R8_9BILA|nr:unnamed protein product [Soboliphyme baturini]
MDSREFTELTCYSLLQKGKYIFGKTKVFFRVGQVAFIETQRSAKLFKSAVTIQKTYRMHRARLAYKQMRRALSVIQIYCRAWLAWRWSRYIQMHRAALIITSFMKGLVARMRYLKLKRAVLAMQRSVRVKLARAKFLKEKEYRSAVVIQKHVRTFLARRRFLRLKAAAIIIQCCVRSWMARRKLRELKLEAKSFGHLQNLNKGLEKKIMTIQEKMDLMAEENGNVKRLNSLLNEQNNILKAANNQHEAQLRILHTQIDQLKEILTVSK